MPIAVELFFDDRTTKAITDLWENLHRAGFKNLLREGAALPHLSIGVFDSVDIESILPRFTRFCKQEDPLELLFTGTGFFRGTRPAIFLVPAGAATLYDIHKSFFEFFPDLQINCWQHYRHEQWIPHTTIAQGFKLEELHEVLHICEKLESPMASRIVKAGIVEFPPTKNHFILDL